MVIITGADGFIGQHLAPLILKQFKNTKLLCLVGNSKTELERRGVQILKQNRINYLSVDLVTKKNFDKLPKSPQLIIHLAANTDTSVSDHRINDQGTKNLFTALNLKGPKIHFIYTATTVVYSGRKNTDKPITEQTIPYPTNEYGRTKLKAEEFLKSECTKLKIPLTILKVNTVYGDDYRKHKLFAFLKNLILKKSIIARLNWPGLTSIVHVDDVSKIILKLSKNPPPSNKPQTFIIYSENLTLSQISKLMHKQLGVKYLPVKLPKILWITVSFFRPLIPMTEKFLPAHIYNIAWRFSLIINNVIYCKSNKLLNKFPDWKPLKLKDTIKDTLI